MSSSPTLHPMVAQFVLGALGKVAPEAQLARVSFGARIPHQHANWILKQVVAFTGRRDLGVMAAECAEPGDFELVEVAARIQRTFGEALEALAGLLPMVHDSARMEIKRGPETSRCELSLGSARLHPVGWDFIAATLLIAARRQTGAFFTITRIELPYARSHGEPPLHRLVECPVTYDAPVLAVEFPSAGLALPLARHDPSMQDAWRTIADGLAKGARSELEQRLREALESKLPSGDLSTATLARQLHVSERTLRRKLEAEGLNLRGLLDEVRRERALALLRDERASTDEVAAQLGYTTPQAFHRAFRRWTGVTVRAERTRIRQR
ncbi:MAG: AraC family transcriptional regulator ligand-binding domain-containing protein [Polyangiales bacterium]